VGNHKDTVPDVLSSMAGSEVPAFPNDMNTDLSVHCHKANSLRLIIDGLRKSHARMVLGT
jgi:hypothetical protein